MTLTHQRLTEALKYDPLTGLFTRDGKVAGSLNKDGYVQISLDRERHRAHRLAWFYVTGEWPVDQIDHRNGARADNRWDNLREATSIENLQNLRAARSDNAVGLLGVDFHKKAQRWRTQIRVNKKKVHIGYFDTPEEAHAAYLAAKREHHPFGEIAKLPHWLTPVTS